MFWLPHMGLSPTKWYIWACMDKPLVCMFPNTCWSRITHGWSSTTRSRWWGWLWSSSHSSSWKHCIIHEHQRSPVVSARGRVPVNSLPLNRHQLQNGFYHWCSGKFHPIFTLIGSLPEDVHCVFHFAGDTRWRTGNTPGRIFISHWFLYRCSRISPLCRTCLGNCQKDLVILYFFTLARHIIDRLQ